jgi:hypothetical protein
MDEVNPSFKAQLSWMDEVNPSFKAKLSWMDEVNSRAQKKQPLLGCFFLFYTDTLLFHHLKS